MMRSRRMPADAAVRGSCSPMSKSRSTINGTTLPLQSGADADGRLEARLGITPHFWMEYPGYPEERTNEGKSLTFRYGLPAASQRREQGSGESGLPESGCRQHGVAYQRRVGCSLQAVGVPSSYLHHS